MSRYFFVLGRNPTLSLSEIVSILNFGHIQYKIEEISQEIAVFLNDDLNVNDLMATLGGTVKIGKILDEARLDEEESKFSEVFSSENLIKNYLSQIRGKVHIGISIYDTCGDQKYVAQLENKLKDFNLLVKENLKRQGIKAGFVRIKERYLSSVSVAKNQLLTKGAEIVLVLTQDKILLGKTLAVQEFGGFTMRDIGRPERDKRSGIMPPKLARIMINLVASGKDKILLDPFCGSGTILQEAIILGYKNIVGLDISETAVVNTRKNIDWLFQKFRHLDRSSYNIKIQQADARKISNYLGKELVDAIITEPYLGPPLFKKPEIVQVKKILNEITGLYIDSFKQFQRILESKGKIVIIFPAFEIQKELYFVDLLDNIKSLGFIQKSFFTDDFINNRVTSLSPRKSILYGGAEQFVKREILAFEKMV